MIYFDIETVYFIRILYFDVIFQMFEWFLNDLMSYDGVNAFDGKH